MHIIHECNNVDVDSRQLENRQLLVRVYILDINEK